MSDDAKLFLFAQSLLSKWGFRDGDEPDAYLDWLDEHGLPYPADWHATLRDLVREHLMPLLADYRVELVEVETSHNPIRAEKVDGREVDWYRDDDHLLPDVCAEVPFDVVYTTQLRFTGNDGGRA